VQATDAGAEKEKHKKRRKEWNFRESPTAEDLLVNSRKRVKRMMKTTGANGKLRKSGRRGEGFTQDGKRKGEITGTKKQRKRPRKGQHFRIGTQYFKELNNGINSTEKLGGGKIYGVI